MNALSTDRPCSVLDFAGGTGLVYYAIRPFLARPGAVDWDVVDNPRLAEIGMRRRSEADRLRFLPGIPDASVRYDVVHVNTSLQYLPDPWATLEQLLRHRPDWLLLTRLLIGRDETFLTSQEVHGTRVPCWFLGPGELEGWLGQRGFAPVFRCPALDGSFEGLWDASVPERLRAPGSVHWILRRQSADATLP